MRPVDPELGPVERFACELRALRSEAGDPPFWKMARSCEVSKSTLAAAAAGHQLPTERVVREFVRVCDGEWPKWRQRWQQAADDLDAIAENGSGDGVQARATLVQERPETCDAPSPAEEKVRYVRHADRFAGRNPGRDPAGRRVWPVAGAAAALAGAWLLRIRRRRTRASTGPIE